MDTFNEMPPDLQEIMVAAARLTNAQMSAYTLVQDVKGRQDLKAVGIEFIRMPDDELLKAKEWCWTTFVEKRGEDPYIDRLIDIYTEYMELKEQYFTPKRLP